jgi:long-chain fatty acid transport protein
MNPKTRVVNFQYLPVLILSCFPLLALASALTPSGYGSEGRLMGGADAAVARDTFAVNINPAGLAKLLGQALVIHASNGDLQQS